MSRVQKTLRKYLKNLDKWDWRCCDEVSQKFNWVKDGLIERWTYRNWWIVTGKMKKFYNNLEIQQKWDTSLEINSKNKYLKK